jgi:hypothetical protein
MCGECRHGSSASGGRQLFDTRGCMSVPADSDEISVEWLTAALHQAGAVDRAQVTSIQTAPIGQMGIGGQVRRVRISYDRAESGAPRSLVLKFSAPNP